MEIETTLLPDNKIDSSSVGENEKSLSLSNPNPTTTTTTNSHSKRQIFILFMIMGYGAYWVLPACLNQQIPEFQLTQPEGLCISTYMSASLTFGVLVMTCYLLLMKYGYAPKYEISVPILIVIAFFATMFAAATWSYTIHGVSIFLYIAFAIGGSIGSLSTVIFNPFLSRFENNYITGARTGAGFLYLLSSVLAVAQGPGSAMRFSVSTYLAIFGALLFFPIFGYLYITRYKLGLRNQEADNVVSSGSDRKRSTPEPVEVLLEKFEIVTADEIYGAGSDNNTQTSASTSKAAAAEGSKESNVEIGHVNTDILTKEQEEEEAAKTVREYKSESALDDAFSRFLVRVIPASMQQRWPWLPRIIPYVLVAMMVNLNTWGLLPSIIPFSFKIVSEGFSSDNGSGNLAIAFQIGAVCCLFGELGTVVFKTRLGLASLVFLTCASICYAAVFSSSFYHIENVSASVLIVCYAIVRFLESNLLTTCYRQVAGFPACYREKCIRLVGVCDQICTTVAVIILTIIVSQVAHC